MALNIQQRLDRLKVRSEELKYWRAREGVTVNGWSLDGKPIELGAAWWSREGVHKFTASAEVPAHWPLEETRLVLDLGGESLVTLSYPNRDSVSFGIDPYHREFPLKHRQVAISAESTARDPFGVPVRAPRLNRAVVQWIDQPVHRLYLLLKQVHEACLALGNHAAVPHMITVAEACQRSLDWPSATEDYIARMAPSPEQQKIWELPPGSNAPAVALDQAQRQSVAAAYDQLIDDLRALQQKYPQEGELLLTGHAHIDLAWLWPYSETRRKMRRTFHTALSLMEASDDFRFNQSTAHYYAQIEEDDPALLTAIKARVASGQWETIGGMWVEPDTNMPTGESLVRQILYGQRYFEKNFGKRHTVCWLPDCFGFSGALPQLLKQGGIDNFFTIKVNWSETNQDSSGPVLVGRTRWQPRADPYLRQPDQWLQRRSAARSLCADLAQFPRQDQSRHVAARGRLWRWRWRHDARNGRARGAAARFPGDPEGSLGPRRRLLRRRAEARNRGDAAGLVGRNLSRTAPRHAHHAVRRQTHASPGRAGADHRRNGGVAGPYARRTGAQEPRSRNGAWCSRTSSTTSCRARRSTRSTRTPRANWVARSMRARRHRPRGSMRSWHNCPRGRVMRCWSSIHP